MTPRNRRILIAALLVGAGFLLSKLTGILDDMILARIIGPGRELDAYTAAFGPPDLLFTLVTGGALASALIPVLSGLIDDRNATWRLVSMVVNLALIVTAIGAALLALLAPSIVSVSVGRGFDPEQQALTVNLMRLILVSTVVFSISAVMMSTLHAHQHFLLPALAPILYNLGILAGVIVLGPTLGVWGPTLGVVFGSLLHLAIQIPGLVRHGARWSPALDLRDPRLRRVLVLLAPRIVGLGVVQIAMLTGYSLASELGAGSVTVLRYGWLVMQLPETVIATAVATAVFPTLSALAASGQRDELRATMSSALRSILALTVPSTFGLIVLGRPLVRVLFEGGLFEAADTDALVWTLNGYALGLIGHSMVEVCARVFYAQQDTRTPLWIAIGAMSANVAASLILRERLGVAGLALGNSIGVSLELLALLSVARHRLNGVDARRIAVSLLRFVAGSIAMAIVIVALQTILPAWPLPDALPLAAALRSAIEIGLPLAVAAGIGLIVYVAVASAIGSEEVRALTRLMLRRRGAPG